MKDDVTPDQPVIKAATTTGTNTKGNAPLDPNRFGNTITTMDVVNGLAPHPDAWEASVKASKPKGPRTLD